MDFWRKRFQTNSMIIPNIIMVLFIKLLEMILLQKIIHWVWEGKINEVLVDIIVFCLIMTPFTYIVTKQKFTIKKAVSKYQILAEDSLVGIYTFVDGKITFVNQKFINMSGYSKNELIGMPIFNLVHPEDLPIVEESLRLKLLGIIDSNPIEIRAIKKDHSIVHVEIHGNVINSNGETQILGTILDITERKLNEKLLRDLAYKDALTGLTNRRYFEWNFNNAVSNSKSGAIMFLDLDGFKSVNDRHGHEIGDIVLKEVGSRISSCFRSSDTLSRIGGDEFVAFLPNIDKYDAIKIGKRIIHDINKPFIIHNQQVFVSTSIGIAFYLENGEDIHTLMKNADLAMYHAKTKGKNKFSLYDEIYSEMA